MRLHLITCMLVGIAWCLYALWRSCSHAPITPCPPGPIDYLKQGFCLPQHVLATSSDKLPVIARQYQRLFKQISSQSQATDKARDLQILGSAYMLRVLALKPSTSHVQLPCDACTRARQTIATLQQSVLQAQENARHWQARCEAAEGAAVLMKAQVAEAINAQVKLDEAQAAAQKALELRARCAPPCFNVLIDFLRTRCLLGEEHRVSSAELHDAFTAFMVRHAQQTDSLSQSELRSCMEKLGFAYAQAYYKGTNQRCLKGVQLRPDVSREGA
jgi:hypothetical protein